MSNIDEKKVLGPRWYVAHTFTGYENKVKTNIEKIVENRGLSHLIFDVQIPVETHVELNAKGEEKIVETKLIPGYVLVKMIMSDESWHVVRNITGVTGFVGPGAEPTPLTAEEISRFKVDMHAEELAFKVGDKVEVFSGIFAGYAGVLQEIDEEKKEVVVLASTERRDIPILVELKDIRLAE